MKFKENAIKPGMVIHCPTEEDARVLMECLTGDPDENHWSTYKEETCYKILENHGVTYRSRDYFRIKTITEFSDLIEPDFNAPNASSNALSDKSNAQMSAVEVLEWLKVNRNTKTMADVFGNGYVSYPFEAYTPEEIIDKITACEAAKKKPVEVEWVDVVRIAEVKENGVGWYVYEEEVPYKAKRESVEEILRKYTADHEGNHYVVVERRCRVKEDA